MVLVPELGSLAWPVCRNALLVSCTAQMRPLVWYPYLLFELLHSAWLEPQYYVSSMAGIFGFRMR
jgi:hypothetical protein